MFDREGHYVDKFLAGSKHVHEVILLPDCEMWVSAPNGRKMFVYGDVYDY